MNAFLTAICLACVLLARNAMADAGGFASNATSAAYLVVDLCGGGRDGRFSVYGLENKPAAGWTDEYKTGKIVLRRVEIDASVDGSTNRVDSLLPPRTVYYIGVFEITQRQYELVTGERPSAYHGDTRPVESIAWEDITGDVPPEETNYYALKKGKMVKLLTKVEFSPQMTNSFLAVLRERTGLCGFNLPTERQWDYARKYGMPGNVLGYDAAGKELSDIRKVACISSNAEKTPWRPDGAHAVVGSYAPNYLGLYDMIGNVEEWCLDPAGTMRADDMMRVLKGGCWEWDSHHCLTVERYAYYQSCRPYWGGFRIVLNLGGKEKMLEMKATILR